MTEYDVYIPAISGDGSPVDELVLDKIKQSLSDAFGGYTHLTHHSEGSWTIGGAAFREAVTIIRVLDSGNTTFDMRAFKRSLESMLGQTKVLIIAREVREIE